MTKRATHRILLINHYAGSPALGMEYRPFYFAREWVRAGHQVLVVAASFSHLRQQNPDIQEVLTRERIDGVDYLWVRTPAYCGNGLARVLNMATFVARLYGPCRKTIGAFRPDLVVASSTYTWDNWPAAFYAKRNNARYVYELHDLWPLSPMELGGLKPWHPFIWTLQKAEDFACRTADKVISMLPATRQHLIEHGMRDEHFVHVPNGIVMEEWSDRHPVPGDQVSAIQAFRQKNKFLVGYVGGHGLSNALDVLIEAGADQRLHNIGIVCVGKGPEKERLTQKAMTLHSNILFLPEVAKNAVPNLLGMFDVLFIGWARSPLYRFGISPNKLFEYMMSGVPIIQAIDSTHDLVREANCGLTVPPEDASALCQGICKLVQLTPEARGSMGENGQQYVQQHHRIDRLARRFLDAVWSETDPMPTAAGQEKDINA